MSHKKDGLVKKYRYQDYYFDDCPICRAVKAADEEGRFMTVREMREVFKEAPQMPGCISGSMDLLPEDEEFLSKPVLPVDPNLF